jgi:hypothetical protein
VQISKLEGKLKNVKKEPARSMSAHSLSRKGKKVTFEMEVKTTAQAISSYRQNRLMVGTGCTYPETIVTPVEKPIPPPHSQSSLEKP